MRETCIDTNDLSLYLILIILKVGEHPDMYMIPASAWKTRENKLLVYHAYEGKKSAPEYGVNLSARNQPELEQYKLDKMLLVNR